MNVIAPTSTNPLRKAPVAVIDWETTREDDAARTQHPVSVAIVHCELGVIGSERVVFQSKIKPAVHIRPEATKIHGISNEMVQGKPPVEDLIPEFERHLEGRLVAAYNIPFDVPIMQRYLDIPYGTLDPLVWAKVADQYKKGKKLTDVCSRRGITFGAHDATEDAVATAKVMPLLLRDLKQHPKFKPETLDTISSMWSWTQKEALSWEQWFHGWCKKKGRDEPDMRWHRLLGMYEQQPLLS